LSSYNISISTVHLKLHINIAPFPKVLCKYSLPLPFPAAQPSKARQTANKMLKLLRVAARAFTPFKPTFVSSYFSLGPHDIKEFLTKQSLEYRENPTAIRSRYCPFCLKPHNEEPSNLFTLTFRPTSGVFHCFRCGASGSWYDFKNFMMGNQVAVEGMKPAVGDITLPSESDHLTRIANLRDGKFPDINKYLQEDRRLNIDTLLKYKVGVGLHLFKDLDKDTSVELPSVYFPMFTPKAKEDQQTLARVKVRAIYKENKQHMKMMPVGGAWGFFGLSTIPPSVKTLVITEGEYDAVAVHQATGLHAVSLPNGASHLPLALMPWLEQFSKIYLWLDDDLAGRECAIKFAKKLGTRRSYIVRTRNGADQGPKDANDALKVMATDQIKELISVSEPLAEENITTFRELREQVHNKILRHGEESGIMCNSFKWYNEKTKGFRRGELSIVTGSTGSGKTTLLSQLSLDFCRQGIPTLWGSFEIKNEILLKKLLIQFAQCDLTREVKRFDDVADKFQELPLFLLKFFGSTDVDRILEAMDFAVYAYDVAHIVIDNLQFMISGQATGFAKFDLQDAIISRFRTFATDKNVHISIVIHPKKVDDDMDLNISSVFGSAKATQEADNIFVLQNRHKYRLVDVRKNRYDGELGRVGLGFDKSTASFFELTNEEVTDLRANPEMTVKDILEKRERSK